MSKIKPWADAYKKLISSRGVLSVEKNKNHLQVIIDNKEEVSEYLSFVGDLLIVTPDERCVYICNDRVDDNTSLNSSFSVKRLNLANVLVLIEIYDRYLKSFEEASEGWQQARITHEDIKKKYDECNASEKKIYERKREVGDFINYLKEVGVLQEDKRSSETTSGDSNEEFLITSAICARVNPEIVENWKKILKQQIDG